MEINILLSFLVLYIIAFTTVYLCLTNITDVISRQVKKKLAKNPWQRAGFMLIIMGFS